MRKAGWRDELAVYILLLHRYTSNVDNSMGYVTYYSKVYALNTEQRRGYVTQGIVGIASMGSCVWGGGGAN